MDKLISELLILPERVRKGDFVLNLSKGVTEPEKTLDSTWSRPNSSNASTTPWASSSRRSMRRTARRATCTAASVRASRTSWRCCT